MKIMLKIIYIAVVDLALKRDGRDIGLSFTLKTVQFPVKGEGRAPSATEV